MNRWILFMLLPFFWEGSFARDTSDVFRHGKLKNGLTYYVRHSVAQRGRADFYLVQNVGALLENDDQNGLAHFLEHMAFNGSRSFKEGIPRFLERRGVKHFNAETGQDETVYYINSVPTKDKLLVDSCLLVLKDWSGFLLLDPKEIDKERGVIFEERRSRRDMNARLKEQTDLYTYNGSRYATRNVIGTVEVLESFTPIELKAYYHDYYRPDLQAVIVIGDVEPARIEREIHRLFDPIPKRVDPKPRPVFEIPDNPEPLYAKAFDKELTSPDMVLSRRMRRVPPVSLKEMMKNNLIERFYNDIVVGQLDAYINTQNPLFLLTAVDYGRLVRNYNRWRIYVQAYPHKEREALTQLMEEIERIHRFSLTDKELKRQIDAYLPGLEETEKNKDKLPNAAYVTIYQNNFLEGNPISSVEEDISLSREILSELTAKDLQDWVASWYTDDRNWVFVMRGNDPAYDFPSKDEVKQIMENARKADIKPLDFEVTAVPLLDFEVKGGEIVKEKKIKKLDAEEWTLSNGCKVYYKFSDTDGPKVSLMGESPGGKSLLPAEDLPSASALSSLMMRSGLYKHDVRMMQAILKGHQIRPDIRLGEASEGVSGYCDNNETEMLFQIIYLLFEKPRFDRNDFDKFVYLNKMDYENTPRTAEDTISEAMTKLRLKDSPRLWKRNDQYYDAMDFDKMVAIYHDRFRDASDFRFYLTGNIGREEARTLVKQYLGALPSVYRKEQPVRYDLRKSGSMTETIEANIPDHKYIVNIAYTNKLKLKPGEELCIDIIREILSNRYRDIIREDEGGAYGVEVSASYLSYPKPYQFIGIDFQTSTEKGDRMRAIVHEQIQRLVQEGMSEEEVEDIVMMMKKGRARMLKNRGNAHWMEALRYYVETGKDIDSPAYFEKPIEKIDAKEVQAVAKKFFDTAECADIVIKSDH